MTTRLWLTAAIEAYAGTAAQDGNHAFNTEFSRLAIVFGEFRNGLADYFARAG
jgi:hypothetical protein